MKKYKRKDFDTALRNLETNVELGVRRAVWEGERVTKIEGLTEDDKIILVDTHIEKTSKEIINAFYSSFPEAVLRECLVEDQVEEMFEEAKELGEEEEVDL